MASLDVLDKAADDETFKEDVVYEKIVFANDVRVERGGSVEGSKDGRETVDETMGKTVGDCSR